MPIAKGQKPRRLLVGLVLDKSGSMKSILQETIDNTNKQFKALQESDDAANTHVAFFTFSGTSTSVFADVVDGERKPKLVPCGELKDISTSDYFPSGGTAMYDAVGDMINFISGEATPYDDILIVIISDGDENSSKRFKEKQIASMVGEMTTSGWTFTYIGANQDLSKVRASLGLQAGNVLSYTASSQGTYDMGQTQTSALRSYTATRSSLRSQGVVGRVSATSMYAAPGDDSGVLVVDTPEIKMLNQLDSISDLIKKDSTQE